MFPWQSGSNGEEVTQERNLNPRSQRWIPDNSYLQRHMGSAIAYNVWQYFQVTQDLEFMEFYGAELILEIARFWSSIAQLNEARGRYEIHGVMGPDEFHEAIRARPSPGLNNNAYTNIMAAWVLCRALEVLDRLSQDPARRTHDAAGLTRRRNRALGRDQPADVRPDPGDGVISQFEGYDALGEFDWEHYRVRYGNIQRLDLILEAENDSPNRYKLSKQADVLMLFYLFSADELRELFARLGYPFEPETIPRNVAYYEAEPPMARPSSGWSMLGSWHDRTGRARCSYFAEALQSDVSDIQQGTTAEGVHLGAMAGTVDLVERGLTGIEVTGDVLRFNPKLPQELERLTCVSAIEDIRSICG